MNASVQNPMSHARSAPRPRFDPTFDAPALQVPRGKALGSVLAVVPASDGGLWILHQATIQADDAAASWLPPVVNFDKQGNLVAAWAAPIMSGPSMASASGRTASKDSSSTTTAISGCSATSRATMRCSSLPRAASCYCESDSAASRATMTGARTWADPRVENAGIIPTGN